MIALVTLWNLSLFLCLAGSIALIGLIIARGLEGPNGRRRLAARRKLAPVLIEGGPAASIASAIEREVATDLTIELAELTRGSDRTAILASAERLGVPERLRRKLSSRAAQHRLTAAETLALFPDHAAEAETALGDSNPDVRLGAALALAHRTDGPGVLDIIRRLRLGEDEHSLLLVSLMRDLAERDPQAMQAVVFDETLPEEARLAAIDALAEQGHAHAPLLAYAAQEAWSNPVRHARAIAAVGRLAHPSAAAAIGDGLDSEDAVVRAAAAEAAGLGGFTEFVAELSGLLSDGEWRVRFNAGQALIQLGRTGIAAMRDVAASHDPVASRAAATLLAEAGQA